MPTISRRNLDGRSGVRFSMHPRPIHLLPALIAAALLAACAGSASSPTPEAPTASDRPARSLPPVATVPPETPPGATGEVPGELMAAILEDAAERSGVDPTDITVVRAEGRTWNDGSLGCPEPGMVYTQALVDGYHVVLAAAGDEYDYRATDAGSFQLCENGGPPSGG